MLHALNARLDGVMAECRGRDEWLGVRAYTKNKEPIKRFMEAHGAELIYDYERHMWCTTPVKTRGVRDFIVSIPDGATFVKFITEIDDLDYDEQIEYSTFDDRLSIINNRGPVNRTWNDKLKILESIGFKCRYKRHAAFTSAFMELDNGFDIWIDPTFNPKAWCRYAFVKSTAEERQEWCWDFSDTLVVKWEYAYSVDELEKEIVPRLTRQALTTPDTDP